MTQEFFLSLNNGQTWNLLQSNDTLREVYTLTSLGRFIYASANDSIFRSSDSGLTCVDISDHPLVLWPNFSFGIVNENLLFCNGYFPVVYRSSDNGNSWHFFGQGLDTIAVSGAFYTSQNFVFFDYLGVYLYRRPLSDFDISSVAYQSGQKQNIQSYPNPFSHSTQIAFTPASVGYAEISVVNLLARRLRGCFRVRSMLASISSGGFRHQAHPRGGDVRVYHQIEWAG